MARILLGVSGGIAAYKALELVRLATKAGHSVRVVQTPAALEFVGAASFAALTGAPVLVGEHEHDPARGAFPDQRPPDHEPPSHLELVRNADVLVVAPATANTIAKLAHGLADNLLTSAALAATCPLLVAPAMNHHMWHNAATQANVELLRARGATVLEPGTGALATRDEWGAGRLTEPSDLLAAVELLVPSGSRPWDGLRVLVTAGGTREPIDAVRYVGNRSSGRMGLALAAEAAARGAQVALVAANVALAGAPGVRRLDVETAAELLAACEREFADCDVLLMAAAVADFTPSQPAGGKLEKRGREGLTIALEPTVDVLARLAASRAPGQTIVGFAAQHGAGALERGREKLLRKGLDAIVVNDVSREGIGFDALDNEVTIVSVDGERHVPRATKNEVARAIADAVDALRATRAPTSSAAP
ncbi:MAG: bifunctional phosphopantothenoylcysteine decarboxylase/phosphopantothenate--cysteine ligase CoaBC [Solirubrobacteraceae bacterium]|nr:bifunctional phosphopantothenoylcysteine decarboxylase/phosphopantothenate--cysteine ligase CoaBC [Solirubrobacteraceae bacterium]